MHIHVWETLYYIIKILRLLHVYPQGGALQRIQSMTKGFQPIQECQIPSFEIRI
jgi:hypothetical protein